MALPHRPLSLVTGASPGIGAAFARALAARGHTLILTARRADRLEALAGELPCRVVVIPADLAAPDGVAALAERLAKEDLSPDWLINNAGYGVPYRLEASEWRVHRDFLRVMVEAPTELARRLLPAMQRRGYGRIVNVASLAGFAPGTDGNTLYAASKAYLIRLSESLALENRARGIKVTALCPGFTRSEFHDVSGSRALVDRMPGWMWLSADRVAEEGIAAVEAGRVIHVPGTANRLIRALIKYLPDPLVRRLSARGAHRYRLASEGTP